MRVLMRFTVRYQKGEIMNDCTAIVRERCTLVTNIVYILQFSNGIETTWTDQSNFRGHFVATMAALEDIRCRCKACTRIRVTIDQIFCVLDIYGWLLNSYVVVCNIK